MGEAEIRTGYPVKVQAFFLFETKPIMEVVRAFIRERKGRYTVTLVYIDGTTQKVQG